MRLILRSAAVNIFSLLLYNPFPCLFIQTTTAWSHYNYQCRPYASGPSIPVKYASSNIHHNHLRDGSSTPVSQMFWSRLHWTRIFIGIFSTWRRPSRVGVCLLAYPLGMVSRSLCSPSTAFADHVPVFIKTSLISLIITATPPHRPLCYVTFEPSSIFVRLRWT
jgi:hypothetical protein